MGLKADSDQKIRKERTKWKIDSWEEYDERERELLKRQMRDKVPTIVGQVRITAGRAKNVRIEIPRKTRPLTDRMKTQIFDTLQKDIVNRTVLDLYAGSGSFGLEAVSRGAKSAVLVDAAKHAEKILEQNIMKVGFLTETTVVKEKVMEFLKGAAQNNTLYEIIFLDPPYKNFKKNRKFEFRNILDAAKLLLPAINDPNTKDFKGVIIIKHPRSYEIENIVVDELKLFETFVYGMNAISIYIVDNK